MTTTPKPAPSDAALIEQCAQHLETIASRDSNGHRADYFRAAAVDVRSLATIPAAEAVAWLIGAEVWTRDKAKADDARARGMMVEPVYASPQPALPVVADAQIKHMVDRFLAWKLPESFNPDGGISFQKTYGENTPWPGKHEPVGTNLLDGVQATAMVRHMVEGLPVAPQPARETELVEALRKIRARTYSNDRGCALAHDAVAEICDIATAALRDRCQP